MDELDSERVNALFEGMRSISSDLSLPLLMTLVAIAREPGMSINELAERLSLPQQTASRYVGILQGRYETSPAVENCSARDPLVTLGVNPRLPRQRALFLTPHGVRLLADFLEKIHSEANKA